MNQYVSVITINEGGVLIYLFRQSLEGHTRKGMDDSIGKSRHTYFPMESVSIVVFICKQKINLNSIKDL